MIMTLRPDPLLVVPLEVVGLSIMATWGTCLAPVLHCSNLQLACTASFIHANHSRQSSHLLSAYHSVISPGLYSKASRKSSKRWQQDLQQYTTRRACLAT